MRRFVIGDIHGNFVGLKEVLDLVNFDYQIDKLFCLGDVCDGWSETKECLDLLMSIKNLILIKGNHDDWALSYYEHKFTRLEMAHWIHQGGFATKKSLGDRFKIEKKYIDFLASAKLYYITKDNMYFAHASIPLNEGDTFENYQGKFYWDRTFIQKQYNNPQKIALFSKIFIGHTPTIYFNTYQISPLILENVYMMDTGAGHNGSISLMNIDTDEYVVSEPSMFSYPNEKGRL